MHLRCAPLNADALQDAPVNVDILIVGVFVGFSLLVPLRSRRDLRAMEEYRERFRSVVGTDAAQELPADRRRRAKREIRRGKPVTDRELAEILVYQYDALGGSPPDFTGRTGLIGIAAAAIICILAAAEGRSVIAAGAGLSLLVLVLFVVWKWWLLRAIHRSIAATRQMHQSRSTSE
jgi:hypothetical protein